MCMYNPRIINEMLHYMKTGKTSVYDDVIRCIKDAKNWCPFSHGKKTNESCYRLNLEVSNLIFYLKRYLLCFEYLNIDIYQLKPLNEMISNLEMPERNFNLNVFKENVKYILRFIKQNQEKIYQKINLLTCEESIRLDESINAFSNNLFFSSVIMAVSAVEARLHYLLKQKNKQIYKTNFENATLGQIIQLFDENQFKDKKFIPFKKILPEKYKPLMQVLNYYRVFSAHPKAENVDYQIAQSILNFSFSFLLDEKTKIDKKLTKHK